MVSGSHVRKPQLAGAGQQAQPRRAPVRQSVDALVLGIRQGGLGIEDFQDVRSAPGIAAL